MADKSKSSVLRCVKFGCENAVLIFSKTGAAWQSSNGFIIVKIDGWYCPNCGAGYGGSK
jgi:hypothetical protein